MESKVVEVAKNPSPDVMLRLYKVIFCSLWLAACGEPRPFLRRQGFGEKPFVEKLHPRLHTLKLSPTAKILKLEG